MQERLTRKRHLEIFLSKIEPPTTPKAALEQYTISVEVAAGILYLAAYTHNDILDKKVADLGCGTGRLALGAAWLGAKEVVGIDIDREAVRQAKQHAKKFGLARKTHWIIGDIDALRGKLDTVLQNPPFGVQKKRADRKFLEKALAIGHRVYSLHKSSSRVWQCGFLRRGKTEFVASLPSTFLKRFIEENGGEIEAVYTVIMTIPRMFDFHTKPKHRFMVDLYVIEKRDG